MRNFKLLAVFIFIIVCFSGCPSTMTIPENENSITTSGVTPELEKELEECVSKGGHIVKTNPPRCVIPGANNHNHSHGHNHPHTGQTELEKKLEDAKKPAVMDNHQVLK